MTLPISTVTTEMVELSGGDVPVHGLTLKQGRACRDTADEWHADALCIAWGTDTDVEETKAWLETASATDVRALLDTIMRLSGMGKAAQFPE